MNHFFLRVSANSQDGKRTYDEGKGETPSSQTSSNSGVARPSEPTVSSVQSYTSSCILCLHKSVRLLIG